MQAHSASERSVGYLFLMRARVVNQYPTHPFRTVSEGVFSEVRGAAEAKITHLGHAPGFTSGIQYLRYASEVEGSIPWRRKRTRRSSSLRTRAPTFPSW